MHSATTVLALALASGVSCHSMIIGAWVNGAFQGDGRNVYIRSPRNNDPVKNLASPDLVCNVNGGKAVGSFVTAAAGDTLTIEWYHDKRGDDIIADSHKGPILTYIAPYTTSNAVGSIWTKIAEEGFAGGKWAVDKLIANKGKQDVILPANLAAGQYLVRQEIIALHESDARFDQMPARGAQFYPGCLQVNVTGSGSAVPDENFDFNTGYTYDDPGIHFNLYGPFTGYKIPGPVVWGGASSGPGSGGGGNGTHNGTHNGGPLVPGRGSGGDSGGRGSPFPVPGNGTVPIHKPTAPCAAPTGKPTTLFTSRKGHHTPTHESGRPAPTS